MDHGFSFFWPAGRGPCLLLPNGQRVDLIVEGKIPYFTISGKEALGQWMRAVAAGLANAVGFGHLPASLPPNVS
eukprot:5632017-Pyramimonas_sp.AAC.1